LKIKKMNKALFAIAAVALIAVSSIMMMEQRQEEEISGVNREILALWKEFKKTHSKKYATPQ
jgi:hypothetical protein